MRRHGGRPLGLGSAALLALLIITALTAQSTLALTSPEYQPLSGAESIRSVSIFVPAVAGKSGELIEITVSVGVPGHGVFRVYSGSSVGNSTYYSLATATYVASLFIGISPDLIDVNVTFHTREPISGPSASLAIATAIYELLDPLANVSMARNYVVTGAIIPQGYAGPVGGVPLKCRAAASKNLHFIAPLANKPNIPPDCAPHVAGFATSLLDVASISADTPRLSLTPPKPDYPATMRSSMAEAARTMARMASELISNVTTELSRMASLDPTVKAEAANLLNLSHNNIILSNKTVDSKPYSAASYAFTALYQALTAYYTVELSANKLDLQKQFSKIENTLLSLENAISRRSNRSLCLERLEILSVAAARLSDAFYSLDIARLTFQQNPSKFDVIASSLAGAQARIYSIESWLSTFDKLDCTPPFMPNITYPMKEIHKYSNIIYNYTVSVLKEVGFEQATDPIKLLIERANEAYNEGDYVLALGYYRDLLSKSTSILFNNLLSVENVGKDIILSYLNTGMTIFTIHEYQLMSRGAQSALGEAYLEYALDLADRGDAHSALKLISSAIAAEEILLMMIQVSAAPSNATIAPPQPSAAPGVNAMNTLLVAIASSVLGASLGFAIAMRAFSQKLWQRLT